MIRCGYTIDHVIKLYKNAETSSDYLYSMSILHDLLVNYFKWQLADNPKYADIDFSEMSLKQLIRVGNVFHMPRRFKYPITYLADRNTFKLNNRLTSNELDCFDSLIHDKDFCELLRGVV